jgi:hypothetical protein
VSIVSAGVAVWSVIYSRRSANASVRSADAATRSADLAEVVEKGRHHGWRIEARTNDIGQRFYTLRNVGTIDARDVQLAGAYMQVDFHRTDDYDRSPIHIAAGQSRLFYVMQANGDRGGAVDITWTPDLLDAEPMTWTEVPPIAPHFPQRDRG